MTEQKPIYCDRNVVITNHLATIFGVSYPVRAISSIKTRRSRARLFAMIVGAVLTGLGLAPLPLFIEKSVRLLYESPVEEFLSSPPGVFAIIGAALLITSVILKPGFKLNLITNARERVVITSTDSDYIRRVRAAIEQAIIGAGQAAAARDRTVTVTEVTPQFAKSVPKLSNKNRYPKEA